MKAPEFKIKSIDHGFCRILYKTKNKDNQSIYYCLQDDGEFGGVQLYRCTQPPWFEPEYRIKKFKEGVIPVFESPTGDSLLEEKCRKWISNMMQASWRIIESKEL